MAFIPFGGSAGTPASGSAAAEGRGSSWPARLLLVFALLVPSAIFGWVAVAERSHLLNEGQRIAERTVRALGEHFLRVIDAHELVLRQIDRAIAGRDWDAVADDSALRGMLAELQHHLGQDCAILLIDGEGRLRAASPGFPMGAQGFGEREYVARQRQADSGVLISGPFDGMLGHGRRFAVSIRRGTPDGRFDGVLAVTIPVGYFAGFWRHVSPMEAHEISVMRSDGAVLLRDPGVADGLALPPDPALMAAVRAAPSGFLVTVSPADGSRRIGAYAQVDGYPVFICFRVETAALLGEWWRNLTLYAAFSLLATAGLVASSLGVMRQSRRMRRLAARWRGTANRLAAEIERRRQAEQTLLQAQKMEAVGQLTGGVAHDFNNLLQAIGANLYLARGRTKDVKLRGLLDAATQATARAGTLTQQLMAFARRQRLEPKPIAAKAMILGMAELLQRTLGGTIDIDIEVAEDAGFALADPTQTEMAILNLALNARDAMPDGGRLSIAVETVRLSRGALSAEPPDGALHAAWAASGDAGAAVGDTVMIRIADTGAGIAADMLPRVVEPFFTTKEVGKGSGLGLSMVHGFALQSGGALCIDSWPGRGTAVRLYLPRAAVPPPPSLPPAATVGVAGQGVILLVDDEALVRLGTAAVLEQAGYRVVQARSGAEALEGLEGELRIDLLLTDYAMPRMTGIELARAVLTRRPGTPVLVVTGHAAMTDLSLDSGPCQMLHKPFEPVQLLETVRRLVGYRAAVLTS